MAFHVGNAAQRVMRSAKVGAFRQPFRSELHREDFPYMPVGAESILSRVSGGIVIGNVDGDVEVPDVDAGDASIVSFFDDEGNLIKRRAAKNKATWQAFHEADRKALRSWKQIDRRDSRALHQAERIDRRGDRYARDIIDEISDADGEPDPDLAGFVVIGRAY